MNPDDVLKLPAIGVRFEIEKLTDRSSSYGVEAWKVLWRAVQPGDIPGVALMAGDERGYTVYTIACIVLSKKQATVAKIREALGASAEFKELCADPPFLEGGPQCAAQPLVVHGRVFPDGTLDCTGAPEDARWALDAVKQAAPGTSTASTPTGTPSPKAAAPAPAAQEGRAPQPATAVPDRTPVPPGATERSAPPKKKPWWKFW
jgi:hypothetical protein